MEPTQICRGFTNEQWIELRQRLKDGDESAWNCAIEVFGRRIRERFVACIDALMDADSELDVGVSPGAPPDCSTLPDDAGTHVVVPGFAIMALCCLLVETLQSFRERTTGDASTTDQFKKYLRRPGFDGAFEDDEVAKRFVQGVRNGILHEAETRGWVIWRKEPTGRIVQPRGQGFALNRTDFCQALKREFDNYLEELRDPGNTQLRDRFVEKMNDVAKEC
jgi:hypothetical protein